jgi:hypothetical protein
MRRGLVLGACAAFVFAAGSAAAQQPPDGTGTIVVPPPGQAAPEQPPAQASPGPPPAQPAPAAPPKKTKVEKEWYGWQVLGADGAAAALMIAGQASGVYSIFDVGFAAYLLAPPVVHVVHNNAGPAFGSLGLRLVSPWVGVAIGLTVSVFFLSSATKNCSTDIVGIQSCDYDHSEIILFHDQWPTPTAVGFNVGLVAGYLLAIGIDAGLISWEKVEEGVEYGKARPPERARWWSIAPSLALTRDHGSLGVRGTF